MAINCSRCGQCCISASVALCNVSFESDTQDLGKWLELHHCRPERVTIPQGDVLGVRIPLICRELVFDSETGLASCQIHGEHPRICQDYLCERAKQG